MASLKQRTISGIKWQVINKVIQKMISVISFAILARILEPATFGLFALAFVMIDGIGLFRTFGIDAGVIRRKECPDIVKDTAFFIVQSSGIVIFIICFFSAPIAAHFFKNPEVKSVIQALGFIFIMSCMGRISQAVLVREMKFKLLSVVEMIGSTLNSVFAVIFALFTPTVWALVGAYLIKQLTITLLTVHFSGYKFKWQFDFKIAKELFHFGKFLVGESVLWFLSGNIGNVAIARCLGTVALGYYALAGNIINFMNSHFTALTSNVLFPAYATLQNDPEDLKRAYLKTNRFVAMINTPFCVAIIILARDLTLTLYGKKWLPIVPLMQLIAFTQIVAGLTISTGTIFNGCGKPKYAYYLALVHLICRIPLIIIFTMKWGVYGTVASNLVLSAIVTPAYFYLMKRIVHYRYRELIAQILPSMYCSLIMAASIFLIQNVFQHYHLVPAFHLHNAYVLLSSVIVGFLAYVAGSFLIDRSSSIEMKQMLFKLESA